MKIDDARVWSLEGLCRGIRADEDDAIAFDGYGFGVRHFFIHRIDVAVEQDQIGRRGPALGHSQAEQQNAQQNGKNLHVLPLSKLAESGKSGKKLYHSAAEAG
jgi:hypothetical protein